MELPLGIVFAKPTIEMIAEYINGSEKKYYTDIQSVATSGHYQLSAPQKRLFVLETI